MRLLDLFCGAGGAAVGYHRAGFSEIVGVDIKPQPRYPFRFVQGDAIKYLSDNWVKFDVFHASPPCQRWSIGNRPQRSAEKHHDFIAPTRRWFRGIRRPWVIENVRLAPMENAILLCGTMFDLKVFRHRLFESKHLLLAPAHSRHDGSTGAHRGYSTLRSGRNGFICVAGHNFEFQAAADAMRIDWMKARWELAEAIPPAYTEYIGRQLLAYLRVGACSKS